MTYQNILVTGSNGFLGRHVVRSLSSHYPNRKLITATSQSADLTRYDETHELLATCRPDAIVHLAGFRGCERFRRNWTADCLVENSLMAINLYKASHQLNLGRRIVSVVSAAAYPEKAPRPLAEDALWTAPHRADYLGSAMGSKMAIALAETFRWQVGVSSSVVIVPELYGQFATPIREEMGVVESMIQQITSQPSDPHGVLKIEGDKNTVFDLVYVGDIAELIPSVLENESIRAINFSQGTHVSLGKLAETVCRLTGQPPRFNWTSSDADELPPPCLDPHLMRSLGWTLPTSLEVGLKRTIDWLRLERRIPEKAV